MVACRDLPGRDAIIFSRVIGDWREVIIERCDKAQWLRIAKIQLPIGNIQIRIARLNCALPGFNCSLL